MKYDSMLAVACRVGRSVTKSVKVMFNDTKKKKASSLNKFNKKLYSS